MVASYTCPLLGKCSVTMSLIDRLGAPEQEPRYLATLRSVFSGGPRSKIFISGNGLWVVS